jgi:cytoskeletal protein CcmA (bactofilin family)
MMDKRPLVIAACVVLLLTSCSVGSRRVVTEERKVSGFDEIVFEGLGELTITQGDREALTVEAESNVISRITTEVKSNTLYIGLRPSLIGISVVPTKPIRHDLQVRDIRALEVTGLGSVSAGAIRADRLQVDMNGGGKIVIRVLDADVLELGLSGLGGCEVAGKVRRQDILITGGGDYDGAELASETADVTLTGLGKATVWASGELDIQLTGAGSVEYYGNPRVNQSVTGLGRVRSLGSK